MPVLKPKDDDFSHPALKACFTVELVKKLKKFDERYWDLRGTVDKVEKKYKDYRIDVSYILIKLDEKLSGVYGDGSYYYFKEECENCGLSLNRVTSPRQSAHIIKRTFFKKSGTNFYKDVNFEKHAANRLFLCSNCHDTMERKGKKPKKRLLKRRIELNKKTLGDLKKDIAIVNKYRKTLYTFQNRIKSYIKWLEDKKYSDVESYTKKYLYQRLF